jgi:3-oxoacyl-[acyl-carrier protein] reductase
VGDFLLALGRRPGARRVVKQLGVPLPLPVPLARADGPWAERPLDGRSVYVAPGPLAAVVATTLGAAGATVSLAGGASSGPFAAAAAAWGRPVADVTAGDRPHAVVVDLTGAVDPADLRVAYDALHPVVRSVRGCGRVVVLARPAETATSARIAATRHALDGFVRSLAKEVGARGVTANLVAVDEGAEDRVEATLRFFMSARSAFVTGQRVRVRALVPAGPPRQVRPLDGQTVLVTGAARGIGAATARALAREGARVLVLDRPEDDAPASKVAHELRAGLILADLAHPDAPADVARAVASHGGVDAIIHNAGVTRDRTLANMDEARWDTVLRVNLGVVVELTSALSPHLRDGGRIVCLASIAGLAGNVGQTNYAASKAGILAYVPALAAELAPRGIGVSGVAPGFIETRLTAAIPLATREAGRRLAALGQGGQPEDVAEVIVYLASPAGGASSGEVLRVCGGAFLGR